MAWTVSTISAFYTTKWAGKYLESQCQLCVWFNTSENSDLTHDVRKKFKMSLQVNYGTNDKRWFLLTDLGMTILYEPNKLWKKHVLGACTWLGKVLTTTEKQKISH